MSIASVSHCQVFGIKSDIKDNIFTVDDETILYPAGSNVVVTQYNQQKSYKRFISVSEKGENISALSLSPDKHLIAVAEQSAKPTINIYDVSSLRRRRTLVAPGETIQSNKYVHVAFSTDSKYVAAILGGPDWILHYYAWDKGKLIASIQTTENPLSKVHSISVNPQDGTLICVLGEDFLKFYRYAEGELKQIPTKHVTGTLRCHSWITSDLVAVGREDGSIFITSLELPFQTIRIETVEHVQIHTNANSHLPAATFQNAGATQISNQSIETIVAMTKGFAVCSRGGFVGTYERIIDPVSGEDKYNCSKQFPRPEEWGCSQIRTIALSTTEGTLLVELISNQILKLPLVTTTEKLKNEEIKYETVSQPFHHGIITGLDICCRKPFLVTCSADRSIRIWNYMTGACELVKYYPEDVFSVAIHPSGLYLLVGFSDKLRLMNVLMDDLRFFKEFAIRSCKECKFSNGGHIFAAAHGSMIQIYSTWTFESLGTLKGHNGKIKSLYWSLDDNFIVSAGTEGAIYTWNVRELKRENEYILKSCSYTSAVCSGNGRVVYAVGSDKLLKEVTESQISCEFEMTSQASQIVLSHSGKMLFVGTSTGTIRSVKFPLTGDPNDFQEHFAHSSAITKLCMSYDDQYLFSASEDGCIYAYKVSEREVGGIKKEKTLVFADEILITRSDLEEKTVMMNEMQRTLEELKLEHEYQLRLKDMGFNEKMKEITEKYSQEIEALKILASVLRTEKDKEEVRHEEEVLHIKSIHAQELHERESKYNAKLMEEYDRFQDAQNASTFKQDEWIKQSKIMEINTESLLSETQSEYENKLRIKSIEIARLQDELRQDATEFSEMQKQNEEDLDTEIANSISKYEKKLRVEKDEGARLKGENGIMRKKFNTLNKDIEDNKNEITRMKDDEKKLQSTISTLEKDIIGLKKEMAERDELIQDKERRVYDLKKKNQELEKFKFVLDYRIKELKEQVEPRENEIAAMTQEISGINSELGSLNKHKKHAEKSIVDLKRLLEDTKGTFTNQHQKVVDMTYYLKSFKSDFKELMTYIQEPSTLKKATENIVKKYCSNTKQMKRSLIESEVKREYQWHHENLRGQIIDLRQRAEVGANAFRVDGFHVMLDNQKLLHEVSEMRKISHRQPQVINTALLLPTVSDHEEDPGHHHHQQQQQISLGAPASAVVHLHNLQGTSSRMTSMTINNLPPVSNSRAVISTNN